jgi:hypothetical protein
LGKNQIGGYFAHDCAKSEDIGWLVKAAREDLWADVVAIPFTFNSRGRWPGAR